MDQKVGPFIGEGTWQFNEDVAARFEVEARTHIPNYEEVIAKCVDLACAAFPAKNARIIDVGSATGYTLERLTGAGFSDVLGVERSASMISRSKMRDRVIHSEVFPSAYGPFDLVLANWTLHFILSRDSYVRDIYEALAPHGIFILTDKMLSNGLVVGRYHDFKRSQGVSQEAIEWKQRSLEGVLTPRPLGWYLELLGQLGFVDISVIDGSWGFVTLIAFKPGDQR